MGNKGGKGMFLLFGSGGVAVFYGLAPLAWV
jgi:hypothetical protein